MPKVYDCIVVGSGASGGWAAKELTERGLEVLMLEAGRAIEPLKDFHINPWPYESKYRGFLAPKEAEIYDPVVNEYTKHLFVNTKEHPYTTPPGKPYAWPRVKALGGRSLVWGRGVPRFSDLNFKAASRDGYGVDWPISYKDIEPYYDKVETTIGVTGMDIGLWHAPTGKYMKSIPLNCGELLLKKGCQKLGVTLVQFPTAVITENHDGRPKCHYCGSSQCGRGCDIGSMFNSIYVTLPKARATKRFTLRTDAMVREVLVDENGKPKGVLFVDRVTKKTYEAYARVIVLAASSLETARILLNSTSRFHPNGLGNSSGVLGKYLHEHIMAGSITGFAPQLYNAPVRNEDGKPCGFYIPRFRNVDAKHPGYIRGFQYSGSSGARIFPGFAKGLGNLFGTSLKSEIRKLYPAVVSMTGFGEVLPRETNYVEIDKEVKDPWGIPVLRIHQDWSDNELKMVQDIADSAEELFRAAGFEILSVNRTPLMPGSSIHEIGTARMGADAKTSVLNPFCQSHDVKNLFLVDGSCFVSGGNQNTTLTILALCTRACEYLAEEFKKGNL